MRLTTDYKTLLVKERMAFWTRERPGAPVGGFMSLDGPEASWSEAAPKLGTILTSSPCGVSADNGASLTRPPPSALPAPLPPPPGLSPRVPAGGQDISGQPSPALTLLVGASRSGGLWADVGI